MAPCSSTVSLAVGFCVQSLENVRLQLDVATKGLGGCPQPELHLLPGQRPCLAPRSLPTGFQRGKCCSSSAEEGASPGPRCSFLTGLIVLSGH